MFSFHKPKVYRSTQGCCICKAKSSSSRFTDSKKYETDFIDCFQLITPRQGEICNACVLLVKRFKRLPPDSDRHWGHVVDARVGPGLKSMTKFKKRKEEQLLLQQATSSSSNNGSASTKSMSLVSERFGKIFKKTKKKIIFEPVLLSPARRGSSDEHSSPSSPSDVDESTSKPASPFDMFVPIDLHVSTKEVVNCRSAPREKRHRKSNRPLKNRGVHRNIMLTDSLISMIATSSSDNQTNDWLRRNTCCGVVYENATINAVILDSNMFNNKCTIHSIGAATTAPTTSLNYTKMTTIRPQPMTTTTIPPRSRTISESSRIISRTTAAAGPPSRGMITKSTSSAPKPSSAMLLAARNLVNSKMSATDRMAGPTSKLLSNRNGTAISVSDKLIDATLIGNKCNDNSSDSGYDEILQEPKKSKPGVVRPVILANGIKLHVQPQNLAMAANLAGVSRIHHNNQSNSAIIQQQPPLKINDIIQNRLISSTTSTVL